MEMTSITINKNWRLVTFSSFVGSVILLVWLNDGQFYKPNLLPVPQNMTGSSGSSLPVTRTEQLAPASVVQRNNSLEKEEAASPQESGIERSALTNVVQHNSSMEKEDAALLEESGKVVSSEVVNVDNSTDKVEALSPESGIQGLEPTKDVNDTSLVDKEEETCNIYEGNWVYDPMRSPLYSSSQCPFLSDQVSCQRNGRQDSNYQNWNWEAKGCNIPRFNGTDMIERFRGKRVILVGDSLNRNQWESLACLLYSSVRNPSRAKVDFKSSGYKVFMAKDYNFSVEFYWSPFLVTLETKANGSRILKLDKLSPSASNWRGADIMVFNTVHWWTQMGKFRAWDLFERNGELVEKMDIESAFAIGISVWANWIDNNVDPTKTTVFFRSISPEHKGEQSCENATKPITDESFEYTRHKPIRDIAERTIKSMKTPVRYLNITKLSQYRRDAHPSIYARTPQKRLIDPRSDCSHWCLPGVPDTWNKLLYASLVIYNSNNNSNML